MTKTRRDFLKAAGLGAAGWALAGHTRAAKQDADDRPNVVLIMTDDQGWGQTGYYNHPVLRTPAIDAMWMIDPS